MAKPYSIDLRERVMAAFDSGEKVGKIAERFCISEKTLYLWRIQRKSRGTIEPITKYQKGHSHKLLDLEKFKNFVIENESKSVGEMANIWGNIGKTTIKKGLKMISFSRKKNLWIC